MTGSRSIPSRLIFDHFYCCRVSTSPHLAVINAVSEALLSLTSCLFSKTAQTSRELMRPVLFLTWNRSLYREPLPGPRQNTSSM